MGISKKDYDKSKCHRRHTFDMLDEVKWREKKDKIARQNSFLMISMERREKKTNNPNIYVDGLMDSSEVYHEF